MENFDDIYNQALELLKQGYSQQEVLAKFSEHKDQLSPLLSVSALLFSMPKNIVPTPLMRRKYAFAPTKNFWLTWIHISKFAGVSISLMLLVSAFVVTGYAASQSYPGQALFAIKKSEEKLQLLLATNQTQKANLEVQIAQSRLDAAQQIFSNPQSGAEQKNAALNELANQTSSAVAVVNTVAKSNPSANTNHPLISSLDTITTQQKTLLTQIKPEDSQVQTAAKSALAALDQNTQQLSEIKQSVAVATNDQAVAKLPPNKDASGIAVGKATSTPTTSTSTIVSGSVQGTSTDVSSVTAIAKKSTEASSTPAKDPNTATGAFIFEDPSPQFAK